MMSTINDPELDALLRVRATPAAPDHLEAQIVAMAARTPQDWRMNGRETATVLRLSRPWYADLLQLIALPKPAYAFSAVLAVGLAIGVSLGVSPSDPSVGDWTNLFASGESWL